MNFAQSYGPIGDIFMNSTILTAIASRLRRFREWAVSLFPGSRNRVTARHALTPYEQQAVREIIQWRDEKAGALASRLNLIDRPVRWIYDRAVPNQLVTRIAAAVNGFLEMLRDASYWTYSDKDILRSASRAGLCASSAEDLAACDLMDLDRLAMTYFTANKVIAALQGAGCGIGGLALLAADLPALFTISLRAIQQIGACYGMEMRSPSMTPVIMNILNTGASFDTALRSRAFRDTRLVLPDLADNEAVRRVIERIQSGTLEEIVRHNLHRIPAEMARNIAQKKLVQLIPLVSAGISAGFNYWFMSNTLQSSYMIFRKLYLERKYPGIEIERAVLLREIMLDDSP